MDDAPLESAEKQRMHADRIALERHVMDRAGVTRGDARAAIEGARVLREFMVRHGNPGDAPKPFKMEAVEVKAGNAEGQLPLGGGSGGSGPAVQPGGGATGNSTVILKHENGAYKLYSLVYTTSTDL